MRVGANDAGSRLVTTRVPESVARREGRWRTGDIIPLPSRADQCDGVDRTVSSAGGYSVLSRLVAPPSMIRVCPVMKEERS